MNHELRLDLCFPPEWARIEPVRQAVRLCVASIFGDAEFQDSIAMVCAELLENAVKYGRVGALGVRLQLREAHDHIDVEVTNDIELDSTHADSLRARIDWMRNFNHPSEAYMAALAEVYAEPDREDSASGLGIVRIAYEGGCEVDCETDAPGRVTVRARYQVPAQQLAGVG